MNSIDSFGSIKNLVIDNIDYKYFDLNTLAKIYNFELSKIPNSIKILLENLIKIKILSIFLQNFFYLYSFFSQNSN